MIGISDSSVAIPRLFTICSLNARLVWRIKHNEKPHFLTGCVVKSR